MPLLKTDACQVNACFSSVLKPKALIKFAQSKKRMSSLSPIAEIAEVETAYHCSHCGEICPSDEIRLEAAYFCCHGCKNVYELLHKHALGAYYTCDVPGAAGISPKNQVYDFLDQAEFRDKLVAYSDADKTLCHFYLPSIHCRSCLYLLENLGELQEGILKSQLNFGKKQLSVWFSEKEISISQLANLLSKIGYDPLLDWEHTAQENPKVKRKEQRLLLQLGITGFCAGNIMLFSFPEYLGLDDPALAHYLGYLNGMLGTVALAYGASDYFRNVWHHLKMRQLTIEAPILLGILVGYGRSAYEILSGSGAGYMDSVSGLIFFLLIGKWFQQKSFDFLSFERNYKSYFPLSVSKLTADGSEEILPLERIEVGDRLCIRKGEIVPADASLLSPNAHLDYAFVSGETEVHALEQGAFLYAGGRNAGERLEIEVVKPLNQSHLTQLWEQQAFKDEQYKSQQWESFANKAGGYFTLILLGLSLGLAAFWYVVNPDLAMKAVVSVLVIACPCALAISYPFVLGHGLRWMAKQQAYLKNTQVMERLSQVDTLVFDKTGTLSVPHSQGISYHGKPLSDQAWFAVYTLVNQSQHPLSRKAKQYLWEKGYGTEIPMQAWTEEIGKGLQAKVQGIGELTLGNWKFAGQGLRPKEDFIASESRLHIQIQGLYQGYLEFPWENRAGVEGMLRKLGRSYDLFLLSGDRAHSQVHLADWFPKDRIHMECSPMDKMNLVRSLQAEGKKVAMLGDGLNDAGALKEAYVGIAIAQDQLSFTPASDVILSGNQIAFLDRYLHLSKAGMRIIKWSFALSILYNLIGLSFAVQGQLVPLVAAILMPLNSLSMLLIAKLAMTWQAKKIFPNVNQF